MRKYRMIDFILLPIKYAPAQSMFSVLYTLLNALLPAYQTIVTAKFIDCALAIFSGTENPTAIFLPIAAIAVYILFLNVVPSIENMISLNGKNQITLKWNNVLINKRSAIEYKHVENVNTQDLINRVFVAPVNCLTDGFKNILSALNLLISTGSLILIVMSSAFWSGIIIIAVSVPLLIVAMRIGKQNYEMGKEAKKIQRKYQYFAEVLTEREYAQERSLFRYSKELQKKYDSLYKQSYRVESKIEKRTYANMKSGSIVTLFMIAVILAIILPMVYTGRMTVGIFVALVNALFSLVQGMSWRLAEVMREHSRLQEYLKDLNDFFSLSEKEYANEMPVSSENFQFESLEFRNVSFRYPGTEQEVLKDCSFVLSGEKIYSIVGANGAGKSTIVKLITGLYDDYEGEILLNEKNIREYSYGEIKGIVAVVFQDFMRYEISLKDNILLGNVSSADKNRLQWVLSQMELREVADGLSDGLETPLGKIQENGVDISGGQWQKIAIARMLYANAPINILDEPTASLDPIAESHVYQMFHKINKNKFTIYITHRLGAAVIADEILVIAQGKVAERGSHKQLISLKNGIYKTMFESQRSWYV